MVNLNFTWGIIIGILVLPVIFIMFVLYLYFRDKIEDFFYKKKYKQKANSNVSNDAAAQANTENKAEHNNHHHNNQETEQQKEDLIKIEDEDSEGKKQQTV